MQEYRTRPPMIHRLKSNADPGVVAFCNTFPSWSMISSNPGTTASALAGNGKGAVRMIPVGAAPEALTEYTFWVRLSGKTGGATSRTALPQEANANDKIAVLSTKGGRARPVFIFYANVECSVRQFGQNGASSSSIGRSFIRLPAWMYNRAPPPPASSPWTGFQLPPDGSPMPPKSSSPYSTNFWMCS